MSQLEKSHRLRFSEEDRKLRLQKLKERTGLRLSSYSTTTVDSRSVSGNVENFIGTVGIPVGLAGPLKIQFIDGLDEVFAPIATSEGALVSSVQRGALALNLAGGVQSRVVSNKMSRAPQFEFESLDAAIFFSKWIQEKKSVLASLVQNKSQHAALLEIDPYCLGRTVHVRFVYSTGNAAGQNMTTFCTSYLCTWLLNQFSKESSFKCLDFIIEGNLSSDKKASALSAREGRGRTVIVEATLSKAILKKILKVNPDELLARYDRSKSARVFTGFYGFNINVANIVAGLFLSTGQDAACIHESSIAEFHMEKKGDDLYVFLYMPCLIVGTVGGGTQLPGAHDSLSILGCVDRENGADRLAQIIASYALALELSTVSAVNGGQFVGAHENLARKSSFQGVRTTDLNEDFFRKSLDDDQIFGVAPLDVQNKQGFVTDIAMQVSKKLSGVFAYEIKSKDQVVKNAFLKLKPHDREIVLGSVKIIEALSPGLAQMVIKGADFLPFKNSHLREIELRNNGKEILNQISPEFLGSFIDKDKETFILIQELIEDNYKISEILDLGCWTDEIKANCISKIALVHREFLNQEAKSFLTSPHLIRYADSERIDEQIDLWDSLFALSYSKIKNYHPALFQLYDESLQSFCSLITEISQLPHSLIHFDFNPRNIAFRPDSKQVKIFDWEFAAWGLPQRDLIEFILFSSEPENVLSDLAKFSKMHFDEMSGSKITWQQWETGIRLATREFVVRRLPFYFVLSEFSFCPYIDRLLKNLDFLAQDWKKSNDQTK